MVSPQFNRNAGAKMVHKIIKNSSNWSTADMHIAGIGCRKQLNNNLPVNYNTKLRYHTINQMHT